MADCEQRNGHGRSNPPISQIAADCQMTNEDALGRFPAVSLLNATRFAPQAIGLERAKRVERLPALDTRRNNRALFLAVPTPFYGIYCNKAHAYRLASKPEKYRHHGRLTKRQLLQVDCPNAPRNAIHEALRYQSCLEAVPDRLRAEVAANFGVSRARVTQILSLLRLPNPILSYLSECQEAHVVKYFTERRLRELIRGDNPDVMEARFRDMMQDLTRLNVITSQPRR